MILMRLVNRIYLDKTWILCTVLTNSLFQSRIYHVRRRQEHQPLRSTIGFAQPSSAVRRRRFPFAVRRDIRLSWLPDSYRQIFRSYVFGLSGFWTMALLHYTAKFDPHTLHSGAIQGKEGHFCHLATLIQIITQNLCRNFMTFSVFLGHRLHSSLPHRCLHRRGRRRWHDRQRQCSRNAVTRYYLIKLIIWTSEPYFSYLKFEIF